MLTEQKSAAQASRNMYQELGTISLETRVHQHSPQLFEQGTVSDDRDQRIAELERMVGRLAMELEMAKKASRFSNSGRNESGRW